MQALVCLQIVGKCNRVQKYQVPLEMATYPAPIEQTEFPRIFRLQCLTPPMRRIVRRNLSPQISKAVAVVLEVAAEVVVLVAEVSLPGIVGK